MKNRRTLFLCSCVLLLVLIPLFAWNDSRNSAPAPVPSAWGGYYQEAFTLTLSAPQKGTIYYTTDGSIPTADSQVYADGIRIEDRTREPNLYNAVKNVVADWKAFTPDPTPVEKGTVVRAVFINERGIRSEIFTQTYFVGIQPPERGYTLSLIFEYDDLFGGDGITVTGAEYDSWYLSGEPGSEPPLPNFQKRIEAASHMELMGPSGDLLNQPVGIRVQGNSTRGLPKGRFILVSRDEYSGSNILEADLFGNTATHSVMLKNVLSDAVAGELLSDRAVATQGSVPVRVYFNGEYWYDTYLLERYDQQYFRQHYKVDDRILLKGGILDEESAANAQTDYYGEFMDWATHADLSDPEQWERFLSEADLQSYIDFIAANYYLCNYDFSEAHNYLVWRSPYPGPSPYEDARWRWCIYDIDVIETAKYNPHNPENTAQLNTFSRGYTQEINRLALFQSLLPVPQFRQQFVLSFMDMLNNNFAPANVEPILQKHGYDLSWMDDFFLERPKYAVEHLAEEFHLTGSVETVTVSTEHPSMGAVTVNTSVIDLSRGVWSGQYFTDYPITVTATPNPGYRFVGWKGGIDETAEAITLPVSGGLRLEAVFAEA